LRRDFAKSYQDVLGLLVVLFCALLSPGTQTSGMFNGPQMNNKLASARRSRTNKKPRCLQRGFLFS
jgi:hypothetical protein